MDDFFGDALKPPRPSEGARPKTAPSRPSYPEPRGAGRPTIAESKRIQDERAQRARDVTLRERIGAGVTDMSEAGLDTSQLAELFRLTKEQVKRRLENCPKHRMIKNNQPAYLVHIAAPYLVSPHDFERRIASMNKKDLPPELDIAIMKAKDLRRKQAVEAGRLVRTEKVMEVFGRVLNVFEEGHREQIEKMMRKETIPIDTMEEIEADLLKTMTNIHRILSTMGEESETTTIADDGFDEQPDDGRDFENIDYGNGEEASDDPDFTEGED